MLADEFPKGTPVFLGGLGCSSDVALMRMQKFIDVIFFKSADDLGFGFLEGHFA
jgi:hypothetical protein